MTIIKSANLGLRFLLEICILLAIGYWGFTRETGILNKIILGVGIPIIIATIWGVLMAPASQHRLSEPFYTIVEVVIFSLAIGTLFLSGKHTLSLVFGAIYLVNKALMIIWKQVG